MSKRKVDIIMCLDRRDLRGRWMVLHRAAGSNAGQHQLQQQGRRQPGGTRHLCTERNESVATSTYMPRQRLVIDTRFAVRPRHGQSLRQLLSGRM